MEGGVKVTLDRVLSKAGVASRTEARRLVAAGRVTVNGQPASDPDLWLRPSVDRVALDGRAIRPRPRVHLLLYKPRGYVCSARDPGGRRTVFTLLPRGHGHLFTAGRLDLDSSGLLVVTNDSQLAEHLMHPDHEVPKTYRVKTSRILSDEEIDVLRRGVDLGDGPTRPAEVTRLGDRSGRTVLQVVLREGRNRQVRRMVETLGAKVLKLVRTAIGPIAIGELPIGTWRRLTREELAAVGWGARQGTGRSDVAPPPARRAVPLKTRRTPRHRGRGPRAPRGAGRDPSRRGDAP